MTGREGDSSPADLLASSGVSTAVAAGPEEVNASERAPEAPRPGRSTRGVARALGSAVATLATALLVLVVVLAIFLALVSRDSDRGVPDVFGHSALVILSGSMTPTFDAGDLIVDKIVTASQASHLQKGQVITFEAGPTSAPASVLITHRIYRVRYVQDAKTNQLVPEYETKGDANPAPDDNALVPSRILGLYEFRVPYGGYVLNVLHQPLFFILLVSLPFAFLVLIEGTRRWKKAGEGGSVRRS